MFMMPKTTLTLKISNDLNLLSVNLIILTAYLYLRVFILTNKPPQSLQAVFLPRNVVDRDSGKWESMTDDDCACRTHVHQQDPSLVDPIDSGEHDEAESGEDRVHRDLVNDEPDGPAE